MTDGQVNAGDRRLDGKRILITAGAGGAGLVMTQMMVAEGAKVIVCDIDKNSIEVLQEKQPSVDSHALDMGNEDAISSLFSHIEHQHGGLDGLVNNVGISGPTALVEDISLEDWNTSIAVNLTSYFLCIQGAVRLFKPARSGSIVNISSMSARLGLPLRTPYVVTKDAVLGMTRTLARELGPSGIRVNAILPGAIEGERMTRIIEEKSNALGLSPQEYRTDLVKYTSMRTMVMPKDIGEMAMFLLGDGSARVTGQLIAVDGNIEWEQ